LISSPKRFTLQYIEKPPINIILKTENLSCLIITPHLSGKVIPVSVRPNAVPLLLQAVCGGNTDTVDIHSKGDLNALTISVQLTRGAKTMHIRERSLGTADLALNNRASYLAKTENIYGFAVLVDCELDERTKAAQMDEVPALKLIFKMKQNLAAYARRLARKQGRCKPGVNRRHPGTHETEFKRQSANQEGDHCEI
jgi:hypothetical protein